MLRGQKRIYLIILAICVVALFGGCKKGFHAGDYIRSILDAGCKGELKQYMRQTGCTEEEAQAERDNIIAQAVLSVTEQGVSPELQQKYVELFQEIYSKTKYKVKKSKSEDNGYVVTVEVQPLLIAEGIDQEIETIKNAYISEMEATYGDSGDGPEEAQVVEDVYGRFYEMLKTRVDAAEYGEKEKYEIHLTYNDETKTYEPNVDELRVVEGRLINL